MKVGHNNGAGAEIRSTGRSGYRSARARRIAAEIRVAADKKLGDKTPTWIVRLAEDGEDRRAS